MFLHTSRLQFEAKPDRPDAHYARKLQELIGGACGEMTVTIRTAHTPALSTRQYRGDAHE